MPDAVSISVVMPVYNESAGKRCRGKTRRGCPWRKTGSANAIPRRALPFQVSTEGVSAYLSAQIDRLLV